MELAKKIPINMKSIAQRLERADAHFMNNDIDKMEKSVRRIYGDYLPGAYQEDQSARRNFILCGIKLYRAKCNDALYQKPVDTLICT